MQKAFMQIGNALMKAVLRSPLHCAISNNTLLIAVTGHKMGVNIIYRSIMFGMATSFTSLAHAGVSSGATCAVACTLEFAYKGEIWKGKEWLWRNVLGY